MNPRNDDALLIQQSDGDDWQRLDEQRKLEQEEHLRNWRKAWDLWGKTGITKETANAEDR